MRVLLCSLFVIATSNFLAPSSEELHNRYGTSDSEHRSADGVLDSEHFSIRPSVGLTAHYGSDGRSCELQILPTLDLEQLVQRPYLTDEIVPEVLEELVPAPMRGEEFGEGTKIQSSLRSTRTF